MASFPTLRADLRRESRPDGSIVLHDDVTAKTHTLPPEGALVVEHLDAGTRADGIASALRDRFPAADYVPADVAAFVNDLRKRLLLDERAVAEQIDEMRQGDLLARRRKLGMFAVRPLPDAPDVEVRPGLRYGCMSCGACCSGRFRVELTPRDHAVLEQLDFEPLGLSIDDVVEVDPLPGDSHRRQWLRRPGMRCVFLGPDSLCEIHRHFGYEHKPLACRIFPFYPILTPNGVTLQFRPECSTQHRSATEAPLVSSRLDAIWDEISGGLGLAPTVPLSFELRRDDYVDYQSYLRHETHWRAALADGWRAGVAAACDTLAFAPPNLAAVEALQRVLERIALHFSRNPKRLAEELAAFCPEEAAARCFTSGLQIVGIAIRSQDDRPLDPAALRTQLTRIDDEPELADQLARYLDDTLFSKFVFYGTSAASGFATLLLTLLLARLTAAATAVHAGVDVDADRLNEAVVAWHMFFYNRDRVRAALCTDSRGLMEALLAVPASELP